MVQTFVIEETKTLIYESESIDQWKEKCDALGLDKQLALTQPGKSPVPFEFMNTVSKRVYETICPAKVEFKDYDKTPIPLEVLGLIKLCVDEKYFSKIEIWYDDKSPDPLAIGRKSKDSYTWNDDFYLIARWGDVLRPFEELKSKAIAIFTNSKRIEYRRNIVENEAKLKTVEEDVLAHFDAQTTLSNPSGSLLF